jgi:hypothetical protein
MDFAFFDRRHYPTLAVRDGYREWAETYEDVVQDEMDLRLLARIESVDWAAAARLLLSLLPGERKNAIAQCSGRSEGVPAAPISEGFRRVA